MIRKTIGLTVACFVVNPLVCPTATAQDGTELLRQCRAAVANMGDISQEQPETTTDAMRIGLDSSSCIGQVMATMQLNQQYRVMFDAAKVDAVGLSFFCAPEQHTLEQAIRIVYRYVNEHPERHHQSSMTLMIEALSEAFPCDSFGSNVPFDDSNQLQLRCQSYIKLRDMGEDALSIREYIDAVMCREVMTAVIGTGQLYTYSTNPKPDQTSLAFCFPESGMTTDAIIRMYVESAQESQIEASRFHLAVLVMLRSEFPCE